MAERIGVAVAGAGYWGKNLVRNFAMQPQARLLRCCDLDRKALERVEAQFPTVRTGDDFQAILSDPEVRAVVVATSAVTHHRLARAALEAGKHVFVEKPLALSVVDAEDLVTEAEKAGRILMVGHLLEYHPAVEYLKGLLLAGELGDVHYIYTQRVNLGRVRQDENALWSFAPHDISVVLHLLEETPFSVTARGQAYIQDGIEDVVFVTMRFQDNRMAHIHLSWLDPHKVRRFTIVGSRKMAVFDDVQSNEKVRLYDKGVDVNQDYTTYGESLSIRSGDIHIPRIDMVEPLSRECAHFLDCVARGRTPRSDGMDGLNVIRVLQAAQESLEADGAPVSVNCEQ